MGGWESVGTIKWPAGQRPARDVVCQPAKVSHKHKTANLLGLGECSAISWIGVEEIVADSKFHIILTYS